MYGIVLQKVSQCLRVGQIVDRYKIKLAHLHGLGGAHGVATYSAEAVDAYSNGHLLSCMEVEVEAPKKTV